MFTEDILVKSYPLHRKFFILRLRMFNSRRFGKSYFLYTYSQCILNIFLERQFLGYKDVFFDSRIRTQDIQQR